MKPRPRVPRTKKGEVYVSMPGVGLKSVSEEGMIRVENKFQFFMQGWYIVQGCLAKMGRGTPDSV